MRLITHRVMLSDVTAESMYRLLMLALKCIVLQQLREPKDTYTIIYRYVYHVYIIYPLDIRIYDVCRDLLANIHSINWGRVTHKCVSKLTSSGSGVGVTKAPFVNFSVSRIFDLAKVPVRLFASHSYLTGVTAAELRQHLSNMNVIYNS